MAAGFARDLAATEPVNPPDVRNGDFQTADLGEGYEAVTYWSGFGVGSDHEQRLLLTRAAREWLVPYGRMIVEVSNPTWWARVPSEPTRHEDLDSWQQTLFDAATCCRLDYWWSQEDAGDLTA